MKSYYLNQINKRSRRVIHNVQFLRLGLIECLEFNEKILESVVVLNGSRVLQVFCSLVEDGGQVTLERFLPYILFSSLVNGLLLFLLRGGHQVLDINS